MNNFLKNKEDLEKGFFGFWVRRYKVSYLFIFLVFFIGLFSLYTIPKESSPDIKFGIVGITTIYSGVNPTDIDGLITEKIEDEIKDIDGIKKITSSSSVGISSISVEFNNGVDISDALIDVKDAVDKVSLPADANDPIVTELSTSNELMFQVLLYGDSEKYNKYDLMQKAQIMKNSLEGNIAGLSGIDIGDVSRDGGLSSQGGNQSDYDILILLDKTKIENLGLSIISISDIIKSYNKNTPLGNFTIGDLNYDFRFDGELGSIEDLKNIVIRSTYGSNILLKDIANIKKEYNDNSIKRLGFFENSGYDYISLAFNKSSGSSIFSVSSETKKQIDLFLSENINFPDLGVFYTNDLSEIIKEDYSNLSGTALQTLLLVFVTILLFVGFRESIIASMLLPLSFLITFFVLDTLGLSLNFLTNFSLVLTLGIAIDTVIVIIEGASERIKLGYNKRYAVLIAVRDFKAPLIAGTLTTLVAFLPLMFLPGVIGKFFAYIPITVFSTLLAALLLSLTVSSTLFVKLVGNKKTFHIDKEYESTLSENQKEFLLENRKGKIASHESEKITLRDKILNSIGEFYYKMLKKNISGLGNRLLLIITPFILLVITFIFLSPNIGFTLFPSSDEGVIQITIEGKTGSKEESLLPFTDLIDNSISKYEELKVYNYNISGNKLNISIELISKSIRKEKGLRNVFEMEDIIYEDLSKLESKGLTVSIKSVSNGPPTGKAVGIKLIAKSSDKVDQLKEITTEFENYFKTIEGTKNISSTSNDSPGQFIFKFDENKIASVGLTPNDILGELYYYTSGIKAGSIKSVYEDNDIVLKIGQFDEKLTPENIENIILNTKVGKIRIGDFATYEFTKAVSTINRIDGNISITVESDLNNGFLPTDIQPKLNEFAEKYNFPEGISFSSGGENVENAELIASTIKSLFIALFLIFSILVFQFNSFSQPAIVLYSVILALLGVNIGLYLTGNPYSMPFMIGFIALTGVVVNDAIILIDRINKNIDKGLEIFTAVLSAGKSRLQPIIVTTLTTVFGVLPLALQDEFWAGLGFTIIFGLISGSSMTLFVIPALYYTVYKNKKNKED